MPLFGRKRQPETPEPVSSSEQAVLVRIAAPTDWEIGLDEVEDRLIEAIDDAGVGEFDGNEIGPEDATLYM